MQIRLFFPSPYSDHDCPPFKLLHNESAFQIRTYDAADWALTEPGFRGGPMGAAIRGIRHLIHYFKGGNADNVTMDMTVPFSSVIRFGSKGRDANEAWTEGHTLDAMDCESGPFRKKKPCPHRKPKVDFGLYLPDKYQGSAPEPALCSQVRVAHVPEYSVAVRSFGGHATPWRVKHELHALFESLDHFKSTLRVDYKVRER